MQIPTCQMQFALTPFLIICSNQQTRQNALGLGETQTSLWTIRMTRVTREGKCWCEYFICQWKIFSGTVYCPWCMVVMTWTSEMQNVTDMTDNYVYKIGQFCFVGLKCCDLRAFLGVKSGFKILVGVKDLTFCNSGGHGTCW